MGVPESREVIGILFDVNVWYECQVTSKLATVDLQHPSLSPFIRAFSLTKDGFASDKHGRHYAQKFSMLYSLR